MEFYIVDDLRKFPAEFLGQENDTDFFIRDSTLQSFLQLIVFMDNNTFYTGPVSFLSE